MKSEENQISTQGRWHFSILAWGSEKVQHWYYQDHFIVCRILFLRGLNLTLEDGKSVDSFITLASRTLYNIVVGIRDTYLSEKLQMEPNSICRKVLMPVC